MRISELDYDFDLEEEIEAGMDDYLERQRQKCIAQMELRDVMEEERALCARG